MPLPIHVAHRNCDNQPRHANVGQVPYLRPDGGHQYCVRLNMQFDLLPVKLKTVLVSTQHNPGIDRDGMIRPDLIDHVIRPAVPAEFADDDYEVFVNPTGNFVVDGPVGDCGLTGRKIIVDTYGGYARRGEARFQERTRRR